MPADVERRPRHRGRARRARGGRCTALPRRRAGGSGAAAALAAAMLEAGVAGPVLFPCGEIRRDELPTRLRHEGIEVDEVVCYRSVLADEAAARAAARARRRSWWWRVPSVADLLARAARRGRPAADARRRPHHRGGGARVGLAAGGGRGPARRRGPAGRRAIAAWRPADATDERSLPPRVPARAGGAAAGLDDAPGRPLSAGVSRGARPGRFPHHGAHARAGGRGDAAAGGHPRRGRGDHLQRHPGRAAGDGHGAHGGGRDGAAVPRSGALAPATSTGFATWSPSAIWATCSTPCVSRAPASGAGCR